MSKKNSTSCHACLMQVKTSMLAMGAVERVKRIAREWPKEMAESIVLPELILTIKEEPHSLLSGACMSALSTISLNPDGRQMIFVKGASPPLITLIKLGDLAHPNTDKAISLLMNLAADGVSRKQMREEGLVEALVALINTAPFDSVMEHCLGTLHNVMLTDSRAKRRAVEANIAEGIARVLSARLQPEGCLINVRINMIISDLLQIQDLQDRVTEAAKIKGWKIPPPSNHKVPTNHKAKQKEDFDGYQESRGLSGKGALSTKKEVTRSMKTQASEGIEDEESEALISEI